MIYVGIDPGLTGAIAMIQVRPNEHPSNVVVHPTQTIQKKSGREYDVRWMADHLTGLAVIEPVALVLIEAIFVFPHAKANALVKMGRGEGLWEGMVAARAMRYELVRPAIWKKGMLEGLDSSDKQSSVIQAGRLFPGIKLEPKDHDQAEALLIAEYGRRRDSGN